MTATPRKSALKLLVSHQPLERFRAVDALLAQARLRVVREHPAAARILRRRLGAADDPQPPLLVELVDVDAAVQVLRRLAAHVDVPGSLANPGAAAAGELELRVAAEDLVLARVLVGRRREVLADHPEQRGDDESCERCRHCDAADRNARGAHDRELAVAREPAEPDDRADQRADRQELVGLLRQLQRA